MQKRGGPIEDRFWNKVEMIPFHECWEWTGTKCAKKRYGYLKRKRNQSSIGAHRFSWILHFGPIPDGLYVCHKCDNPGCVRPDHLFLATNQENTQDRQNKNRQMKGEKMWKSKLTAPQVIELRLEYSNGITTEQLAEKYKVTNSAIRDVIRRKTWKHI